MRLSLACFRQFRGQGIVYRRLLKINDHLVTSFIHKLTHYGNKADDYQRAKIDISEAVDKQLRKQAWQVMAINIDESIHDSQVRQKAFEVVPQDRYPQFLDDFKKPNLDRDFFRWQYYGQFALTIKKNIRPLFKTLEFSCANAEMTKVVAFLKQHLSGNQPFRDYDYQDVPLQFFPKRLGKFKQTTDLFHGILSGDKS
jgi:hypothetical protein